MATHSSLTLIEVAETFLVGQSIVTTLKEVFEAQAAKRLHEAVTARIGSVQNRVGTETYLVEIYPETGDFTHTTPFTTFIGVRVADPMSIPDGLTLQTIPAGRYAKVTHHGLESELSETYDFIYGYGLKEAGLSGRRYHFELWDERYQPESPANEIEIFVGVR